MKPLLPGATIGVVGGGQLGRMFCFAAHELGYRVRVFSPEKDAPACHAADLSTIASYEDAEQVRAFGKSVDVVTFEFENIPLKAAELLAEVTVVRPSGAVLATAQNRLKEKQFLAKHNFPHAAFYPVPMLPEGNVALAALGGVGVLKTASFGYDGKGQRIVRSEAELQEALDEFAPAELVMERLIDLAAEISVIIARRPSGEVCSLGPFLNVHQNHILDSTRFPAGFDEAIEKQAITVATAIAEASEYVGVLCVEFFVSRSGELLVNELAPRPHNSGHLTIDAFVCSQFRQQVRAVCDLPLGSNKAVAPAAMVNLLGNLWSNGEPRWERLSAFPDARLHLYGKTAPQLGRKMGHLTVTAKSADEALEQALAARAALGGAAK